MHGCGNDYIFVDATRYHLPNPSHLSRLWSDRHKGIGSDGLVIFGKPSVDNADFSMRIFNADGSEALMCGNAARCIGKYVYERGLTNNTFLRLETLSGVKQMWLSTSGRVVESVTIDMGVPVFEDKQLFRPELVKDFSPSSILQKAEVEGLFMSMGNPHYVIFTDDVNTVESSGHIFETHPVFPKRCNIEFAHVESKNTIRVRVWERGSGITMACGTGACATAVAAAATGRVGRKSSIIMDGGKLFIEWKEADNHVYMTGPAEFVFDGEIMI